MAHRAVTGRLAGVGVGKSKELSDQRLTVLWLRPHCRAIDRTDLPLRRSRTYLRTSSGVTRGTVFVLTWTPLPGRTFRIAHELSRGGRG
jgi:hypothetical protein